jgi:small nuclear ribonucleoprotein (snRNP)-like protein
MRGVIMGIDNRLNIKENDAVELANGELYHVGRVYDDGSIEGNL